MEESVRKEILREFACGEPDVRAFSPLALAYLGDAVFDLVIRTLVVEQGNRSAHELHRRAIRYVNAAFQARMIESLLPELTEEETSVYKRGRNAKSDTVAKNADVTDYRKATGLEALVGYLYLRDRMERILELMRKGIETAGTEPGRAGKRTDI